MARPDDRDLALWAGLLGVPIAYDVWADRNRPQGTLTNVTRYLLRLQTSAAGRAALVGAWAGLTYWLIPHLMHCAATAVETVREELTAS